MEEIRRIIREVEPVKPSTRLTQEFISESKIKNQKSKIDGAASSRLLRIKEVIPLLRGDLDWIVMKALEKDRARRYETANGLAMDVQRYLSNEPVVARPPGKLYRFQKLARRNKLAFAAGAAVLLALVAGLAVSTWFYFQEKAARQRAVAAEQEQTRSLHRAEASETRARDTIRFLTDDVMGQATPEQNAREKNFTIIEALNAANLRLDKSAEIAQQPELEADLRLAFGRTYHLRGDKAKAEVNLRRAFDLRRRDLGPTNLLTLQAEYSLGDFLEELAHEHDKAGTYFREVWQARQQLLGPEHTDTLAALQGYQVTLYQTAHFKEAEQIARDILSICERRLGRYHADTIEALIGLGASVGDPGDHAQAEALCREAIKRCERSGTNTKTRLMQVKELAVLRTIQGDPAEAERLMTEAIPLAARELGPTELHTLHLQRVLARAFADEGCFVEAESWAGATLEARLRQSSDLEGNGRTMLILGRALVQQGKLEQAEPLLQAALPLLREYIHTKDAAAALAANWLGAIQASRKAYREAENLMLPDSERLFDPANQLSPTEMRLAMGNIIALYEAWRKPEQAAIWRRKLGTSARPRINQN